MLLIKAVRTSPLLAPLHRFLGASSSFPRLVSPQSASPPAAHFTGRLGLRSLTSSPRTLANPSGAKSDSLFAAMAPGSSTPAPPEKDVERRKASGFRYWLDVQTRWIDQDQYGHINNAVYYLAADAAINSLLVSHCGMTPYRTQTDPPPSKPEEDVLGLMISTSAIYFAPATFPCVLRVGLRVIKLGQSSVLFELGFFELPEPSLGGQVLNATTSSDVKTIAPPAPKGLSPEALAGTVTRATHVYVDRKNRRPMRPMPEGIMKGLQKVKVEELSEDDKAKL